MNVRGRAATVIEKVYRGDNLQTALAECPDNDRAFLAVLCYGTLRHYHTLQFIAKQLLNKPMKDKDHVLFCLLLVGLYQRFYLDTSSHAAVFETVCACEDLKRPWAKGLLNATLRRAERERDKLWLLAEGNGAARLSHPEWLIDCIVSAWPNDSEKIFAANNQQAPMCLRINLSKITRADYLMTLSGHSIAARTIDGTDSGIVLEAPCDVTSLPGFSQGLLSVQDGASQHVPGVLQLAPNLRVLDACAAPGGKTCHLLEAEPSLHVTALEKEEERAKRITENLARLQLNAKVIVADANETKVWWDGEAYDRILLDVPCSATGVIRRHPDIKLLRRPEDIANFAKQQQALLHSLWPLLKPGGRLLYTTCSILPEENDKSLDAFLSKTADASVSPITLPWGRATGHGWQLLPGEQGCDGFYYGVLQKQHSV